MSSQSYSHSSRSSGGRHSPFSSRLSSYISPYVWRPRGIYIFYFFFEDSDSSSALRRCAMVMLY